MLIMALMVGCAASAAPSAGENAAQESSDDVGTTGLTTDPAADVDMAFDFGDYETWGDVLAATDGTTVHYIISTENSYINQPDGPVLVKVRLENVELTPSAPESYVHVSVVSSVYMGTYTQVNLDVDGEIWQAHGLADLQV